MPATGEIKQGFWITVGVMGALVAISVIWMLFNRSS